MLRTLKIVSLAIFIVFSSIYVANAQIVFGDSPAASARFVYQSWTIENDLTGEESDLTQWYFPVYGFIPVAENLEIHVSSATAGSTSDSSGSETSITGLNDTRVSMLRSFLEDRLMLGVGLNLPTGKATLDPDQSGLGRLLTEEFLNVPSKTYGEGFGFNLETAYAEQVGKFTLGVGAAYLINASYSPVDDVDSYNPGNKFTIGGNVICPHRFGSVYTYLRHNVYGTSSQGDIDVYKVGGITEFALGSTFDYEQFEINGGIRAIFRQTDSRYVSGSIVKFEHINYGSDFRFYSNLGYRLENIGTTLILLDYKRVGSNGFDVNDDEYEGKSNLFGIGVGFTKQATEQIDLSANIRTYTGSANDDNLSLSGFELALSARVTL